jgi:hypothetical protein
MKLYMLKEMNRENKEILHIKYFTEAKMNRGPLFIQPQENSEIWKLQNSTMSIPPFAKVYKTEC